MHSKTEFNSKLKRITQDNVKLGHSNNPLRITIKAGQSMFKDMKEQTK